MFLNKVFSIMIFRFSALFKFYLALLTTSVLYVVLNPNGNSEAEQSKNNVDDLTGLSDLDNFIEETGELNDDLLSNIYYDDKKFQSDIEATTDAEFLRLAENYIQRYINLFLKATELADYKAEDKNEIIKTNVEITLTNEDLVFLQNYSSPKRKNILQRDLFKLDKILSKMISSRKKGIIESGMQLMKSIFDFEKIKPFQYPVNAPILIFFTSLVCIYLMSPTSKLLYAVFIAMNNIILYESYLHYQKKIREAEIRAQSTLKKPDFCDSSSRKWFHVWDYFRSNEPCLEYYTQLLRNPAEEVSLLHSVVDVYAFYFVEKPLQIFGKSSYDLAKQYTADVPWPFGVIFQILVTHSVVIIGAIVILLLCGLNFKFSFFGTSFQLGKAPLNRRHSHVESISNMQSAEKCLTAS